MTLHADRRLACRIEAIAADEMRAFAESSGRLFPDSGSAWIAIADGVAGFAGPDSAVNGTVGLGMTGAVEEGDVAAVERFFHERGARPLISVCPLADPTLTRALAARGWAVAGFENVLARTMDGLDLPKPHDGIEIRVANSPAELAAWAELVAVGFSAPELPSMAEYRLGEAAVGIPGRSFLTAYIDGKQAGTGELLIADGVAWLSADTTLPRFRGRGVQQTLQRARLAMARDAGCDIAVTESAPGSASQRNMERLGFRVVYTRVEAAAPLDRI